MDCRHVVDASSFLLFEATGDSESDFNSSLNVSVADDDAESCSHDSYDSIDKLNNGNNRNSDDDEDDDDDDDSEDHNYDGVNQERALQDMGLPDIALESVSVEQEQEATVGISANANEKPMNDEMENRLFWETCLAN